MLLSFLSICRLLYSLLFHLCLLVLDIDHSNEQIVNHTLAQQSVPEGSLHESEAELGELLLYAFELPLLLSGSLVREWPAHVLLLLCLPVIIHYQVYSSAFLV